MTLLPKVKLKVIPTFPSDVRAGPGITITKENGAYTINNTYLVESIGIPEAPVDGSQYARQTNAWTVVTSFPEAPNDGYQYGRQSLAWSRVGGIDQNSQSTNYTTVLSDAQKHMLHPTADTTARTFTIAANASVAYPVGTAISFVNQHGAGVLTIACGDTIYLASAGTTGNRTLAASGVCTALKITTTEWIISGKGLT